MELLGRIILPALVAGALAGLLLTGLQYIEVIPLIHEAESYETSGASDHMHEAHGHGHGYADEAWAPDNGLERFAVTILTNVVAAIGFGLLLSVSFSILVPLFPYLPCQTSNYLLKLVSLESKNA